MWPVLVMVEDAAARAIPKSVTFTSPRPVIRMLWGFMSRWMTSRSCAALNASAIWSATAAAVQILHRDVVSPILRLTPVEDRDDIRVRKGCGALGLTLEALDELLVAGVAAAHHLEGHVPVQGVVVCQVYVGHATAA